MITEREFSEYKAQLGRDIDKTLDEFNAALRKALTERELLRSALVRTLPALPEGPALEIAREALAKTVNP